MGSAARLAKIATVGVSLSAALLAACATPKPPPLVVPPPAAVAPAAPVSEAMPAPLVLGAPRLSVVQDEASLERRIGEYLTQKGYKVQYQSKGDDVWVRLDMSRENMPNYHVIIDTTSSGRAPGSTGVTERVILLRLYSGLHVSAQRRPAVLAVLNQHHTKLWAGTFVINEEDGEIEGQWALNITSPEATLHPETVFDAWYRLCMSWKDLFPKIAPILFNGGPGSEPTERPGV